MPELKIVVLAHPAVWADSVKDKEGALEKMESWQKKTSDSKSWIKIDDVVGTRRGIYKVESIEEDKFMAKVAYEREVKEDYQSLEEILKEDNSLPEGREIPTPVPSASKATLFIDLAEGVCYTYTDTKAPPLEAISSIVLDFGRDTCFPVHDMRLFEWSEELVTKITKIAVDEGYSPYKVRADLETIKVTAEGDFSDNEDWTRIRDSIDIGKWNTIAFVKSKNGRPMVFGMSKSRKKQLSMPFLGDMSYKEMFEEILEMRRVVEKALGCDIRQYCFPEKITTISSFFQ